MVNQGKLAFLVISIHLGKIKDLLVKLFAGVPFSPKILIFDIAEIPVEEERLTITKIHYADMWMMADPSGNTLLRLPQVALMLSTLKSYTTTT